MSSSSATSRSRSRPRLLQRTLLTSVGVLLATLSLTAAAQAQSIVQIKSSFFSNPVDLTPQVIGLDSNFVAVPQNDNDASFSQHWIRTTVGINTYTFQSRLLDSNGCLKVAESTPLSSFSPIVLGSCSSLRARWRSEFRGGPGRVLVNADGSGHAISPSRGPLGGGEHEVNVVPGIYIQDWAPLIGWSFDFI